MGKAHADETLSHQRTQEHPMPEQTIDQLQARLVELRAARNQVEPTSKGDTEAKKLSNEIVQVNAQLLEHEARAQVELSNEYMGLMHDALYQFEITGFTLTVKHGPDGVASIAYTPVPELIEDIKHAVAGVECPSAYTAWTYGRDESNKHSFDFTRSGKSPKSAANNPQPARTIGWMTPDGQPTTLGAAFDACATPEQVQMAADAPNSSARSHIKVQAITDAGYTKAEST